MNIVWISCIADEANSAKLLPLIHQKKKIWPLLLDIMMALLFFCTFSWWGGNLHFLMCIHIWIFFHFVFDANNVFLSSGFYNKTSLMKNSWFSLLVCSGGGDGGGGGWPLLLDSYGGRHVTTHNHTAASSKKVHSRLPRMVDFKRIDSLLRNF